MSQEYEAAEVPRTGATGALAMARGIAGGVAGGVVGYYGFWWLLKQGYYAAVHPGAMVGLGCGLASGRRSAPLGVLACLGGFLAGAIAEWRSDAAPTDSFLELLMELPGRTPAFPLIVVGAALAYYLGVGRKG